MDYEECSIPEIDTSDSPDIHRRKRRGINVSTEVEVSVPPSFTSVTTEGPFVNLGLASFS
jgi:hypothetical protein